LNVYSESGPWGRFEKFHESKRCTVKLICVNAHSRLSLQSHHKRSEFLKVVRATAMVELDGGTVILTEGETISIPRQASLFIWQKKNITINSEGSMPVLEVTNEYGNSLRYEISDSYRFHNLVANLWQFIKESQH